MGTRRRNAPSAGRAGCAGVRSLPAFCSARRDRDVWPLAMLFAGLAMLATGLLHSAARVTAIAAAALVAMYVIDLAGKLAESLDWIRYASAFKYTGSAVQDGFDPLAFFGLLAVTVGLVAAGAWLFERRDVYG